MMSDITPKSTINFTIRIPPDLHKKLREFCFEKEISIHSFIIDTLNNKINYERNK